MKGTLISPLGHVLKGDFDLKHIQRCKALGWKFREDKHAKSKL